MAEKVNILIVDDLPQKHLVMTSVLEELGQNIVSARSGLEALRLILQMEFAVILLDVNMPDIDGLETAGLIRQYRKTSQTPILFITSYMDDAQVAKGYALGAVDYISSPVNPDILRSKVKVFVDLHRMHRELQQRSAEREALAHSEAARSAAEQAIRRADYLSDVSRRLASSLNIDATVDALAGVSVPVLGAAAAVALLDRQGELVCRGVSMKAAAETSASAVHEVGGLKLNPSIAKIIRAALVSRNMALLLPEALWELGEHEEDLKDLPAYLQGIEKMAVCPLIAGEQVLGALLLWGRPGAFGRADVALITEVVSRASIAMENARLYTLVQDADRRKNEFLAMLAHELRNPLAPIRNAVHIIQAKPLADPTIVWARDVIGRQVDHMSHMVDDLLDISRIVQGKVEVQTEEVLLSSLCERAIEISKPFIDAKQQELRLEIPEGHVVLEGDMVRLSQVLSNLLNNASKFTHVRGHISLSASCHDETVSIVIGDNGQGIEPEFLPHIFELFVQGDQSLDRSQGGLGIGLTLVRRLVELHGGRVEAHSDGNGMGTRISLHFPARALGSEARIVPLQIETAAPAAATFRKVLVVDDLAAAADTLQMLLELEGHEVQVASDGASALELARQFHPEVVILDLGLPGMDGFEVARHLRHRPESKHVLMIALTGYGEAESRLRSQQAGFDHHVVKPADVDFLLSLVANTPLKA